MRDRMTILTVLHNVENEWFRHGRRDARTSSPTPARWTGRMEAEPDAR